MSNFSEINYNKYNLSYKYSITIHKSQGKTIENIFIDYNNLYTILNWLTSKQNCNKDKIYREHYKLLYTAFSRTSKNAYLIISNNILKKIINLD
jgi:ATP-dependent exoDNAse (exonuclease V) alpha subunit